MARRSFRRSAALLAGSTIAGQALVVASAPGISRIYSPRDIGAIAVYAAAVAVLSTLVTLRYESALPLADDDTVAANLIAASLLAVAALSAMAGIGVALFGSQALRATNAEALRPYLWLLPLGLAIAGLYRVLAGLAVRAAAFGRLAWTTLTQTAFQVTLQVAVGLPVAGPLGLLLGSIGGNAAGSGNLLRLLREREGAALRRISRAGIGAAARRYRKFALITSPASTLTGASLLSAPILLAAFYGAQAAGWYALSQRVVALPVVTVSGAVGNVFYGRASELARDRPEAIRALFVRMVGRLALLGVIPFTLLAVASPSLFGHLFGPEWREAGRYVQVLVPLFFVQFVVGPGSQTIFVFERNELQALLVAARLALGPGALVTAHELGASPLGAVAAYGAGQAMVGAFTFWLSKGALPPPEGLSRIDTDVHTVAPEPVAGWAGSQSGNPR